MVMSVKQNKVWRFNIGEWTEAYVFIKLLAVGRLYAMDGSFNKDDKTYFDISNIIRSENSDILDFRRLNVGLCSSDVKLYKNNSFISIITSDKLSSLAEFLYSILKNKRSSNGFDNLKNPVIAVEDVQEAFMAWGISSPKADLSKELKKEYGAKSDMILTGIDSFDRSRTTVGFSIKSHMGSSPTLYNSSTNSGFVYLLKGCNDDLLHRINGSGKFLEKISFIKEHNISVEYFGTKSEALSDNLQLVDTSMEKIIAALLLIYSKFLDIRYKSASLEDLTAALTEYNPLGIKASRALYFYESKMKTFLFDCFAGLSATTPWDGRRSVCGGYIDVDKNGDMLYCRAVSDDVFMSYLYKNTYFDRPDAGSKARYAYEAGKKYVEGIELTADEKRKILYNDSGKKKSLRSDYGYVYKKDGAYFFDINFQIRFR